MDASYRKQLKAIGHKLKPIVTIAEKGLSENVAAELERALDDHELIKVKVSIADRDARRHMISEICHLHDAELVQAIGNMALILRAAQKPKPQLSNLLRPL